MNRFHWIGRAIVRSVAVLLLLGAPVVSASTMVELTPQEQAWIAGHPTIRVASDPVWPPVDFLDGQQRHIGITADYVKLVQDRTGLKFEWESHKWEDVLAAARSGQIDLIPTAGKTPERELYLAYTEPPYVSFRSVIVVRGDLPFVSDMRDLANYRIALVSGYAESADFQKRYPGYTSSQYASVDDALAAVASGHADATIGNLAVVNWAIRSQALTNLRIAALYTDQLRTVHLAVRKDWPELAGILDKALATITPEERAAIEKRWYDVQVQKGLDPKAVWRSVALVLLAMAVIAILVALWLRRLRREIAIRKAAEARIETAEHLLRDVTDNIPGAVFQRRQEVDGRVHYPFLSQGYYRLGDLQVTKRDYATPDEEYEAFPSEERERIETARRQSAETLEPYSIETRMRVRDGSFIWTRTSSVPRREADGAIVWNGFLVDITDRREAEEKLAAAETRLREFNESLPGFLFRMEHGEGPVMRYSYVNDGIVTLFGISKEDALREPGLILKQVLPEDRDIILKAISRASGDNEIAKAEYRARHVDGTLRWLRSHAVVKRDADGGFALHGYTMDVTAEKTLELELAKATTAAEAASRAKSEFLANVSHEIRTPMNAILGLSHLALRTDLTLKQQDYLGKIHSSAQALLNVINDILDLSKIEAGKLSIERTSFDLSEVFDTLLGLIGYRASEKGLELLFNISPDVPQALTGDALRLGQVLLNLASNAIKFTQTGQVMVAVRLDRETEDQVTLRFEITDTGIGISEEQIGHLFESFSQADASTTRRFGGTGLGLSISKKLIEMQGGEIGVSSQPGCGSCFWFISPFGRSTRAGAASKALPDALRSAPILVVDDNPSAREILGSHLSTFGFPVVFAESGAEALTIVEDAAKGSSPIRLILLDWQMPVMNGIETARRLKEMRLTANLAIVIVSAYGREELAQQVSELQLDGLLLKPLSASILLDTLNSALGFEAGMTRRDFPLAGTATPDWSGCRLLLAEDNPVNQQVALEMLETSGATIDVVGDGVEVLEKLATVHYDAVLMDLQMPRMDGLEATRRIRAQPQFAAIPVLAMTANVMAGDRERCLQAGMNDHISKPLEIADLYAKIGKWLSISGGAISSVPSTPMAPIPGIEVAEGLRRLGGREDAFRRILSRFRVGLPGVLDELRQAMTAGDYVAVRRSTHNLKGMAGNVSASRLQAAAQRLEDALNSSEPPTAVIAAAMAAVETATRVVATGLEKLDLELQPRAAEAVDPKTLMHQLERLDQLLVHGDVAAGDLTDLLSTARWPIDADLALAAMRRMVAGYDYVGARARLADFRAALADA